MYRFLVLVFLWICAQGLQVAGEEAVGSGRALFVQYCTDCHGRDAKGGINSDAAVNPRDKDLTKISDRRGGVWPMLEVMSIIDGYITPTGARAEMPVFEALSEGPQMDFDTGNGRTITVPARLVALANYLESIQSPKPGKYVP